MIFNKNVPEVTLDGFDNPRRISLTLVFMAWLLDLHTLKHSFLTKHHNINFAYIISELLK